MTLRRQCIMTSRRLTHRRTHTHTRARAQDIDIKNVGEFVLLNDRRASAENVFDTLNYCFKIINSLIL